MSVRAVLRLGGVFLGIGVATSIADALVQAAFLARAGADALPWVLGVRSVLSPALAFVYVRYARQRPSRRVMASIALFNAAIVVGARVALQHGWWGAVGAYAAHEVATGLLTMHWGIYLLEHLGTRRAQRSVAVVYACSRVGAVIAGVALGLGATFVDTLDALLVVGGVYAVLAPLAFLPRPPEPEEEEQAPARDFTISAEHAVPATLPAGLDASSEVRALDEPAEYPDPTAAEHTHALASERRRGFALLGRSPLLSALALATLVMVVVRIALRYGQQSILDAYDEATLAELLGWYGAAANVVGVVLQLLVTSRLLRWLGVGTTNLLYAVATLVTHVLLALTPGALAVAFAARFTETELKHAIKTPLSPLFYGGFAKRDRVPARALVLGVVSPVAQLGGALLLGIIVASDRTVAAFGITGAVLYVAASWLQKRAYDRVA